MANRTIKRNAKRRFNTYWLTPKAWNKPCSHCANTSSVAVRARDWNYACAECVERLGIKAKESKAWRDGGSRAGATVTVRFIDDADRARSSFVD